MSRSRSQPDFLQTLYLAKGPQPYSSQRPPPPLFYVAKDPWPSASPTGLSGPKSRIDLNCQIIDIGDKKRSRTRLNASNSFYISMQWLVLLNMLLPLYWRVLINVMLFCQTFLQLSFFFFKICFQQNPTTTSKVLLYHSCWYVALNF